MKKILFCLVCVLTCFSMVSAKTQIEYDWGKFEEYEITNANIYKGNLAVFKFDDNEWKEYFDVYKDNGEYDVNIEVPEMDFSLYSCGVEREFYIFKEFIVSIDDFCGEYYQTIYDDEMNAVEIIELPNYQSSSFPKFLIGENDKYYYIGMNVFDKETKEMLNMEDVFFDDPLMGEIQEQCFSNENVNEDECISMLKQVFKKIFDGTNFMSVLGYSKYVQNNVQYDIINSFVGDNDIYALSVYDDVQDKFGIHFFDGEFEHVETLMLDSYIEPYVLFKDNYFYIFEAKSKPSRERGMDEVYYFSVTEYDYEFNKRDEFDLSSLTKEGAINIDDNYGRNFWKVLSTDDGFVLITKLVAVPFTMESNQDKYQSVQKYSFVYNVETKQNDNGSIVVDKESSKNGEMITYTVKPKEGYKLDKVIVTDERGNTIEIKDSSFTMPNSNVTIEAIFVVDNPNTSVFLTVAVACIILFVCYFFIVQKNMIVKQFE